MKNYTYFVLCNLLILFLSAAWGCKRIMISPYLGDFTFTIYEKSYSLGIPTGITLLDTFTYEGVVRKYEEEDDALAINATDKNDNSKVTIHFNSLQYITPEIEKKGKFVTLVSGHKSQVGEFLSKDSVVFTVSNGGGGYSHSYEVIGVRK